MSFSGKATFTAGDTLPEIVEDVSDLVSINSPHETPLLDALGDAPRPARSTIHEWMEDTLLPNSGIFGSNTFTDPVTDATFVVNDATVFRTGDQLRLVSGELLLVTGIDADNNRLTVTRGYGGDDGRGARCHQADQHHR